MRGTLSPKQKLRVLRKARALVNRGWVNNAWRRYAGTTYYDGNRYVTSKHDEFCLVGALNEAVRTELDMLDHDAMDRTTPRILSVIGVLRRWGWGGGAVAWNDLEGRKKSEVLALLDERIAELRAEVAAEKAA